MSKKTCPDTSWPRRSFGINVSLDRASEPSKTAGKSSGWVARETGMRIEQYVWEMGTNALPMCSPHSPPDAAVNRARRLGPKNHDVRMNQAPLAKAHWSNRWRVRCRLTEEVNRRRRKARVVQAQDHFRKRTLRRLRLEAKVWVVDRWCGWEVRMGSDVSR